MYSFSQKKWDPCGRRQPTWWLTWLTARKLKLFVSFGIESALHSTNGKHPKFCPSNLRFDGQGFERRGPQVVWGHYSLTRYPYYNSDDHPDPWLVYLPTFTIKINYQRRYIYRSSHGSVMGMGNQKSQLFCYAAPIPVGGAGFVSPPKSPPQRICICWKPWWRWRSGHGWNCQPIRFGSEWMDGFVGIL